MCNKNVSIRFGTDGWRGVISEEFTFENLRLLAQAVADHYLGQGKEVSMVVGYDTRFLSDRYAAEVARVLAANGIRTWLTRTDAPTPAVSYAIVEKGATAGIMITASHNPPRYNGFKLKAGHGGPESRDRIRGVEERLIENCRAERCAKLIDFQDAMDRGLITKFDAHWGYYQHLGRLINLDKISEAELRVVVDSMYGSGRGCIAGFLARTRTHVYEIRGELNPGFGGIHPEPIARFLQALVAAIQAGHGTVGLATDGDGDRIGAVDERGQFVDPHHIMALALRYLVEKRGWKGAVVKTVSTTCMIDRLARKYGLKLYETPVGFNHIADLMLKEDVLIGGEESGGMSIRGHVPEGDGVLLGLLLLEIMADSRVSLGELVRQIQKEVGPAYYQRADLKLDKPAPKSELTRMLEQAAPNKFNGVELREVVTKDGVKYVFADDSWLLMRPSGTEPVLRVYAEAPEKTSLQALIELGRSLVSNWSNL